MRMLALTESLSAQADLCPELNLSAGVSAITESPGG
jgi:hypothetical protein